MPPLLLAVIAVGKVMIKAAQPLACFVQGHGLVTQSPFEGLPELRVVLQQPINEIIALGQGSELESRRAVDSHDHGLVMALAAIATYNHELRRFSPQGVLPGR